MDLKLNGKTALVTGATAGIGLEIARALLREAAHVFVTGRDPRKLEAAAAELRATARGEVTGIAADPATEEGDAAIGAALPSVDVLVNNLGIYEVRPFKEIDDAEWRRYFEVNVLGGVRLARRYLPGMLERNWGRIVFVSSAAPLRGIANYVPYVSARAAANGLVSSLAKELGRDGITVNAVGSNYVENPDYFPQALLANSEAMAKMTAQIPLGRLGKSDELGATVCFLCSDSAGFITGHFLPHAGGWA